MTQTIIEAKEKAFLLSMDRFFAGNLNSLRRTIGSLGKMTSQAAGFDALLALYECGLQLPDFNKKPILGEQARIVKIPFVIAYCHLVQGIPLFLNDILLVAWQSSAGDSVISCPACNYPVPASHLFTECPVCRGDYARYTMLPRQPFDGLKEPLKFTPAHERIQRFGKD